MLYVKGTSLLQKRLTKIWCLKMIFVHTFVFPLKIYESTNTDATTKAVLAAVASIINDADTTETRLTFPITIKWAMIVTWENLRRFGTFMDSAEVSFIGDISSDPLLWNTCMIRKMCISTLIYIFLSNYVCSFIITFTLSFPVHSYS